MRHGTRGDQVEKRRPGRKKEVRKKMAEKRPKKFSRFMRRGTRGDQVEKKEARNKMAVRNKNGRKRAEKIFALYAPWYSR